MIYTLKNDIMTAKVSSLGAELVSVNKDSCEYIWQGNPAFWTGQAPILFPICGRLCGAAYTYDGKEYTLNTHGFARNSEFSVKHASDTNIVLTLTQNEETLKNYPFDFELTVSYTLDASCISSTVCISNTGSQTLIATFGAHPGFNVPFDKGEFEDWYLEFGEDCTPNEIVLSDTCFNTGLKRAYPLKNSRIFPLRHSLFEIDGVFMDKIAQSVTLKSEKSDRYVTLNYPDMPYIGIWHKPQSKAPYVCIEPWCGLPTYDGTKENFKTKNDMFHILPERQKTINYSITFG